MCDFDLIHAGALDGLSFLRFGCTEGPNIRLPNKTERLSCIINHIKCLHGETGHNHYTSGTRCLRVLRDLDGCDDGQGSAFDKFWELIQKY